MKVFIFDIDGTLADNMHRIRHISEEAHKAAQTGCDPDTYLPWKGKDWDAFHAECDKDAPIGPMTLICRTLIKQNEPVIFVTGRMERCRDVTVQWLYDYVTFWRYPREWISQRLYMRAEGDTRPDYVIKEEILDRDIIGKGLEPVMAFDDRPAIIEMWKRRGILVAAIGAKEPF